MSNTTIYNMVVPAGTTDITNFNHFESDGTTPKDLTGWDVRMQVRANYSKTGTAVLDFSTGNGKIVIATPTNGQAVLTILPTDTDSIAVEKDGRELFYDLELFNSGSGVVHRPFKGTFKLLPQITI